MKHTLSCLLITFLLSTTIQLKAQHSFLNYCSTFFYDTTNHLDARFKSITESEYLCKVGENKKLRSKKILEFGKAGEPLNETGYELGPDSALDLIDSTAYDYSNNYNQVRVIKYKKSHGWQDFRGVSDAYYYFDAHKRLIKDSLWDENTETSKGYGFYISIAHYYKYNPTGQLIQRTYLCGNDITVDSFVVFKNTAKPLFTKYLTNGKWQSSKLYTYDSLGNCIKHLWLDMTNNTYLINREFDSRGLLIKEKEYKNDELQSSIQLNYYPDSSSTLVNYTLHRNLFTDIFGTGPNYSCPYQSKLVSHFDKDSNKLCDTLYTYTSGVTTDTTIHVYRYHKVKDKAVCDTETTIVRGYLHWSKGVNIFKHEYDSNGNIIQEDGYNKPLHKFSFNQQNKLLLDVTYKPCTDKPVKETRNAYYPNKTSLKEHYESISGDSSDTYYGQSGQILKTIHSYEYGETIETDYSYKE